MFIMNPDSVTVISLLLNTLNHTKMYHKETLFMSFFRFDRRSPKYVLLRLRGNHYSPTNHSSL